MTEGETGTESERDVLVAVDVGTTKIKTVAFDLRGSAVASATRETETATPEAGHTEQSMGQAYALTAETIGEVVEALPADAEPRGVGVTGQGDGLWAVTSEGDPVRPAILWSDSRAAEILDAWDDAGTLDDIVAQCGSAPYPGMSLPLLAWLAREEPARFAQVETILSCKDWITYRLTDERVTDHSEATVPYLDQSTGEYDRSVFDLVGLPEAGDVLPELVAPTEIVGSVTEAAAAETCLPEGLPVVAGLFDVPASGIGSGTATTGGTAVTLGTSLTHQVFVEGPQSARSGIQMNLGIDGLWTYAIGSNAGTPSFDWATETVADADDVTELEALAAAAPAGSDGVCYHPYLSTTGERGPFVDPDARGQFIGLTPAHGSEHLARAVYEGLSLAVRDCVEHLPNDASRVALSGGGTRSELWPQLIADCLDRPVVVPAGGELGAKGVAVVLAVGLDEFASLEEAVEQMVSVDRRYSPRDDVVPTYDALYDLYVDVREAIGDVWTRRAETYRSLRSSPPRG
ncbi:FGGY-family carbohydrate kinase [Salinigranum halophilum]|uniref:FGGY-family carbohydrate kinase n=1 Tax=Salinigranum halophilum TaxID=2565931 RepID=UPI00115E720A|nr:FGGY-family carbohydrate kinase [Salinigranum halophilum]